ncbi:MAG: cation-translocating P-type ATPase [Candidatus Bathyarchaeota archaeon]|nr:cation-translocating P-type ATPase [Candidatus Termiticorpusculum sp.]
MNFNRVILAVFMSLGLIGYISAVFELLPLEATLCLQLSSAILALLTIGYSAVCSLRERVFSMDMLATIAILASIASGEYFPATIVAFMLIGGEMLEDYAQRRSTRAIQKLVEEQPQIATVIREGQEIQVKPQEITVGETIIVKSGAKIPTDGVIQKGHAYINQTSITGESLPVEKIEGANVYSGTIVQQGAIYVTATAVSEQSTYGKIIAMVEEAKEKKAPIERAADRYAKYFTPIILILGIIVLAVTQDIMRMAAVFIIACPCALVLSTPVAIVTSIGNAARRGILIRNGETLEKMSKIDTLVMDKTGTITKGELDVVDIQSFNQQYTSKQILQYAAQAEKCSEHVSAKAIINKALKSGLDISPPESFEQHPGLGVCINDNDTKGAKIIVGNTRLMQKYDVQIPREAQEYRGKQDKSTVIFIAKQQLVIGAISLSDQPRENVKNILTQIKRGGIKQVIMLTGDNKNVADIIASTCGVDIAISELMPADKVNKIENLRTQGLTVAMVGDGINDAPALAQADVGIAMGLSGTEIAIETAGAVLLSDNLSKLAQLVKIGKATMSIVKQNIFFAIAVNIIGIVLSSQGLITPLTAAIIHESNALIVMINSLRLLRVK